MNTSIAESGVEAQTVPVRPVLASVSKAAIDGALTTITELTAEQYCLAAGDDELYQDPPERQIVPASLYRHPEGIEIGDISPQVDFYDLSGRRIPVEERPDGWFDAQVEIRHPHEAGGPEPTYTPNAVFRLGDDFIMVGRGQYVVVEETLHDGEVAFVEERADIYLARTSQEAREEKARFLEDNPIIEESKPWWAKTFDVEQGDGLGETIVTYTLSPAVDDLFLCQEAVLKGGTLTFGEVELQNGYHAMTRSEWTSVAGDLRHLADALLRLADEHEEAIR